MTAPDMENIIAGALVAHELANSSRERYCTCGEFLGDWASEKTFKDHQARAVLAAISEAGTVEWAVRWPYLSDMYPERTDTKESQEAAQASIDKSFADGALVSRVTFPWERAE